MIDYSSSLPKVIQCTFWMLYIKILAYILKFFQIERKEKWIFRRKNKLIKKSHSENYYISVKQINMVFYLSMAV